MDTRGGKWLFGFWNTFFLSSFWNTLFVSSFWSKFFLGSFWNKFFELLEQVLIELCIIVTWSCGSSSRVYSIDLQISHSWFLDSFRV